MEAKLSFISTSIPNDPMQQNPMQQQPIVSYHPPSRSSLTYTQAPSGTGDGAAGQSVTTLAEHVEPDHNQAASAYQHRQALTLYQHDFSHVGAWVTESHADAFVIESDSILSQIHRAGAAMNAANRENAGTVGTDEAVELLRASLHRKVPQKQSTSA